MAESATTAITAIADVRMEGAIAASLHRLGWTVLYRATSLEGLQRAISANPEALVLSSSDFRGINESQNSRHIALQYPLQPVSDIALLELIRSVDEPKVSITRTLMPFQGKKILIASSGRTVGASTIALNVARELSTHRSSTLLLDCNPWNPYLSRHLGINGINREIARTSFGFSVGEIVTPNSLTALAPALHSFEQIVIDYGQLREPSKTASGRRAYEEIFSWAVHSHTEIVLVSRSDPRSLEDLFKINSECEQVFPQSRKVVLLSLSKVLSGRERTRLAAQLSLELGANPYLISRDHRAIAEMEAKSSTLADVAPKSLVLSELRGLIEVLR